MADPKSKQDLAPEEKVDNASSSQVDKKSSTETAKRPRLNYLRSAWSTTDLYYHESAFSQLTTSSSSSVEKEEDNIYQIRLPPLQLQDCDEEEEESDEVLKEIFRMITVANVLCLVGSVLGTVIVLHSVPSWHLFLEHHDWMPHAILPFYVLWWIFMMRVLKNRTTEHLRQYLNWTQLSAGVMALTNFLIPIQHPTFQHYHLLFVSFSLISFFIYAFAKRIVIANELKQERFKKRMIQQHEKLQQVVDKHAEEFSNHRLAFLTTVSQEIQDVALMVITTLEQFSPASILSNAHELLSACSIAVPIASISAINTTIRQVCHVSSHLQLLSKLTIQVWTKSNINLIQLPELILAEFDIGELLQNLGDALAGVAAKLDLNLVIYHCDNSLHHTLVIGDEGAIRHALLNHIRNILECCTPGASIEVGLNVTQTKDPKKLNITFYITHTSSTAIRNAGVALLPNANLTAQLLTYIHASCTIDTDEEKNQTKFELSFELDCGKKDNSNKMFLNKDSANYLLKNHYANIKFSNEPSLKDLNKFIENLKGLKMVLHAPEQSIFAKHMTSCLASWNTDISHVPVAPRMGDDASTSSASSVNGETSDHSNVTTPNIDLHTPPTPRPPTTPPVPSPAIEEEHIHSIPPAFILIDDDIATLENKLGEFRTQPPASANVLQQAHHGRRSHHHYQHGKKSSATSQNFFHQGTTAIIHFTSLTNYKAVRDTIQCYAFLPSRDPFSMPRVVVVPKPAGPRRFLTALHTAWNNSVVEPHFSAIATSPSSPMPPMISMLVQREIAAATTITSPNDSSGGNRVSPGGNNENISPGRRARPMSGIFSPPTGDNYFSSQQQQQSSPRRRSTNNTSEVDYLTAKTPMVASDSADVTATVAATVASPLLTNSNIGNSSLAATLDSSSLELSSPASGVIAPVAAAVAPAAVVVPDIVQPELTESIATEPTAAEPTLKKKMGRTMSNFKLHKKKRKEKPFADVVSPPINVLIVEDNIINQAILSAWMKKHKIKFSVASNGLEAVNKWKTGGFHLILMDIQLPVMNGIEATKMIRSIEKEQKIGVLPMSSSFLRHQQEVAAATAETIVNNNNNSSNSEQPTSSNYEMETVAAEMMMMTNSDKNNNAAPSIFRSPVIIVALTASSLESDRHAALAAGCNDFLTKPVSLEWLEKKIIEWGCMQALIDFEGWRRWKKKSNTVDDNNNSNIIKKKLASYTTNATPIQCNLTREQVEAEKKRIEELSKVPNKNGVMLPGVGTLSKSRRFSTAVVHQPQQANVKRNHSVHSHSGSSSSSSSKILLKASKSDSDTHTLSRMTQQSQSETTTTATTTTNSSLLLTTGKTHNQDSTTPQLTNKESSVIEESTKLKKAVKTKGRTP